MRRLYRVRSRRASSCWEAYVTWRSLCTRCSSRMIFMYVAVTSRADMFNNASLTALDGHIHITFALPSYSCLNTDS